MNGHPTSSNIFGPQFNTISGDSDLPFLSNPMGLSFFGNINNSPNSSSSLFKNDPVSSSAASSNSARYAGSSPVRQIDLDRMWGITEDNPIIDDNAEAERQYLANRESSEPIDQDAENLASSGGDTELAEGLGEDIDIAEGIAEGSEVAAAGTPWGLAAIVAQQAGSAINAAATAGQENISAQDHMSNLNQHGVNVSLNADIIQQHQQETIKADNAGGAIGSIFGPLGTVIGRAVAGTVSMNSNVLNTAGSSSGWINPTDTTAANSASSLDPSSQSTMVDNVD